jgi:pyrroline-5-carboxylate reductase
MANGMKTLLVGAGHMGGALAAGWLGRKRGGLAAEDLLILDPRPGDEVKVLIDVHGLTHVKQVSLAQSTQLETVILAVKPQILEEVAKSLGNLLPPNCALVSIMAGVTISRLESLFGKRPIIRAMPNMPASIGAGVTVCVSNELGETVEKRATKLLKVAGTVEWVQDERLMGPVTAVSGSGPAYVFLLAEALAGAGFGEGLPRELAEKLARETIIGAGALLASSDKTPQELRRAVTSPGGTTQAAMDVLMGGGGGLPELVRQAVNAAERRSRRMGAEVNAR